MKLTQTVLLNIKIELLNFFGITIGENFHRKSRLVADGNTTQQTS